MKLATELAKRATGNTLYVLDEPTTGLHTHDVHQLLKVLNQLVEKGNSMLVIEHNLDVIKFSDYVIDLGPEGGSGGGELEVLQETEFRETEDGERVAIALVSVESGIGDCVC